MNFASFLSFHMWKGGGTRIYSALSLLHFSESCLALIDAILLACGFLLSSNQSRCYFLGRAVVERLFSRLSPTRARKEKRRKKQIDTPSSKKWQPLFRLRVCSVISCSGWFERVVSRDRMLLTVYEATIVMRYVGLIDERI